MVLRLHLDSAEEGGIPDCRHRMEARGRVDEVGEAAGGARIDPRRTLDQDRPGGEVGLRT